MVLQHKCSQLLVWTGPTEGHEYRMFVTVAERWPCSSWLWHKRQFVFFFLNWNLQNVSGHLKVFVGHGGEANVGLKSIHETVICSAEPVTRSQFWHIPGGERKKKPSFHIKSCSSNCSEVWKESRKHTHRKVRTQKKSKSVSLHWWVNVLLI